jgi:hypothetical protein
MGQMPCLSPKGAWGIGLSLMLTGLFWMLQTHQAGPCLYS